MFILCLFYVLLLGEILDFEIKFNIVISKLRNTLAATISNVV